MKWIKYQIVCGKNENKEDILILKKVGYNEANLAIAEKEAHNGEYEIVEDTESYDKEPLEVELGGTSAKTPKNARKNLGISAEKTIDSNVASMKVVPKGSGKYTAVNKVGGMCYKSSNLLEYPYAETTKSVNGLNFKDNGDGSLTITGTTTGAAGFNLIINPILLGGKKYFVKVDGSGTGYEHISIYLMYKETADSASKYCYTSMTWNSSYIVNKVYLQIEAGKTLNCTIRPKFNVDSGKPYEAPYTGFRNAATTSIKSGASKNLLSIYRDTRTNGGVLFTRNQDNSFSLSGTCTNNVVENVGKVYLVKGTQYKATGCPAGGASDTHLLRVIYPDGSMFVEDKGSGLLFTPSQTGYFTVGIRVQAGINTDGLIFYPMVRLAAETDETYTPYKESVLEIPRNVITTAGYGLGINENYYNYIDWERKVFVKRCIKLTGFTLKGTLTNTKYFQAEGNSNSVSGTSASDKVICSHCDTYGYHTSDNTHFYIDSTTKKINVYLPASVDDSVASEIEVIAALATPEEIDISAYLQDDNFVEVAAGGVITAVNEYNYDAPTEIEFYVSDSNEDVIVADTFVGNLIGTANNAKVAENLSNLFEDLENPGCYYRMANGVQEWINPPMLKDVEYRTTERSLGKPVYTKVVSKTLMASNIMANTKTNITISTSTPNFELLVKYSGTIKSSGSNFMSIPGFTFDEDGAIMNGTGSIGMKTMSDSEVVLVCNGPAITRGATFYVQVWYTKSDVTTTSEEELETVTE